VYADNAMSDGMVRKWVLMFNEGRENEQDEARSGRPSLVNDDLVCKVNERVHNDRRFTISDLLCPCTLNLWIILFSSLNINKVINVMSVMKIMLIVQLM